MLFFQVLLLAGYSYVLFTTAWIGPRKQALLHVVVLVLSTLYLPLTLVGRFGSVSEQKYPALWLFAYLLTAIGLPIFVISTTSPLLQKWFTRTGHVSANDPYFLFAVSNAGSLLALVSYPLLLEPNLKLSRQSQLWFVGYVVFLALSVGCVLLLWKSPRSENVDDLETTQKSPVSLKRRLYWVLLAFIPSSLLFGVTSYITTEIAPTPLLWTIPLALYLVTFILAFARKLVLPERLLNTAFGGLALLLTLVIAANATEPTTAIVLLHLCFFFVAALVGHGKLASDRPDATRLAEFYLCVAIGGMFGGLFNTLIAPLIFKTLIEYPLVIVLACLIRPADTTDHSARDRLLDFILPLAAGLVTIGLVFLVNQYDVSPAVAVAIIFGIPLVIINHRLRNRPVRFGLALGAVMLASVVYSETLNRTLHDERNFFGTLSVRLDPSGATRILFHGNTIHGRQFINPSLQGEPLSYFHREGPLGQIFDAFNEKPASPNVAIVGLGAGSMACYSRPDQHWTFYEINPAVISIAQNTDYFTYLQKCRVGPTEIILGDARLQLQNAPDHHYGIIVLDAFNSDAIPVHLMTQEAIALYTSKLAPGGMLAFHISNRSLKLNTVLAEVAKQNSSMSLSFADAEYDPVRGKDPSEWLVMAQQSPAFDNLVHDPRWRALQPRAESDAWTDDYSNVLRVFRWY
jgi:spermidine synthase